MSWSIVFASYLIPLFIVMALILRPATLRPSWRMVPLSQRPGYRRRRKAC